MCSSCDNSIDIYIVKGIFKVIDLIILSMLVAVACSSFAGIMGIILAFTR